jgi:hypothetical protein
MSRGFSRISLYFLSAIAGFALARNTAFSEVEVLYVAQTEAQVVKLTTYNVDPGTAVAKRVGEPITIGSQFVDPLTVGKKHVIYVWNGTHVWMYHTDLQGVPERRPSQHLRFKFPVTVNTFLADPDGRFAYAAAVWKDSNGNNFAAIFLFTIDSTGMLTDTHKLAGTWGPSQYDPLTGFYFGASGKQLYADEYYYAPPSCSPGVLAYPVHPKTGILAPARTWFSLGAGCSATWAIAADDLLGGYAFNWGGPGTGTVGLFSTSGSVYCESTMLEFCGDSPTKISFDPADQNLFYGDADTNETYVGHIYWPPVGSRPQGKLLGTPTSIPGTPPIFFNPDSTLVYAVNPFDIGIYAFQPITGDLGSTTSIADSGNVTIATTTLRQ